MRAPRVAALLLLSSAAPALLSGGSHGAAASVAPVNHAVTPRAVAPPGCVDCHAEIAREWRASLHHQSWSDEVFQRSYAAERRQFCRSCHVPLATPGPVPEPEAAAEGIACVQCHGALGEVRSSARGHSDTPAGMQGHAVQRDAAMSSVSACTGCHQFAFPADYGRPLHGERALMQSTVNEWATSRAASLGQTCQHCHMPELIGPDGRTHRSHRFLGAGDDELLRQAVSVSVSAVRRGLDAALTVTLRAGLIGHDLPTGDLFRQVLWSVQPEGSAEPVAERTLVRHYRAVPGLDARGRPVRLRRPSRDTRLTPPTARGPSEQRFTVRVRAPSGTPLAWTLTHQRMAPSMAQQLGVPAAANERVFLRGALRAP